MIMMDENFKGISIDYLDFDIYSKSIGFFYNDKERIGSLFGFVLTVIYMILTLCLFIYYTLFFHFLELHQCPKKTTSFLEYCNFHFQN